jgi:protease secretion system membrane fusion protein
MEIKSPSTGQVVGLTVQTVGAVLQPGQKILDVVPDNQTLLLEAHIPPHLIDKVQAGLLTDIRFNTFAHSPQLVVEGKVLSVSGDLLVDPQNPQFAYFLARVQVTAAGMKTLGARQMQPGMPAEIVIKTGERSMLTYLLSPLTKRLASSMKEE